MILKWSVRITFNELCYYLNLMNYSGFKITMISSSHAICVITLYFFFTIWFEIASDTYWFNWVLNSLVLLLWSMIRNDFILNAYWTTNVIILFWLIIWWKWYLVYVLPPYMRYVIVLRWYMHICDYVDCYCTINNRALDCRMVKEEGSFRANVVEGLAFKCA